MSKLYPHIRFNDDKCREALDFYKKCFGGGELFIQTIGDSPMGKDFPKNKQNLVMHSSFKNGDVHFMASDMMRDKAIVGDNVSMMVDCDSEKEIDSLFKNLSDGGEVFMPVEKQFWGALFGVLTDKYGVEWSLNYTLPKEK